MDLCERNLKLSSPAARRRVVAFFSAFLIFGGFLRQREYLLKMTWFRGLFDSRCRFSVRLFVIA